MLRQVAKTAVEKLLRLGTRGPRAMSGRALILAYHNVIPDAAPLLGDTALHLRFGAFCRQLDLLAANCRVVSLPQLLAGERWDGGPVVAITFDDAYRGAVEVALPELARRGMASTMFTAPGLLGEPSFWWDEVAASADRMSAERRAGLLEQQAGQAGQIRQLYAERPALPAWYGGATADTLLAATQSGLVTLGAHTWSHPNLARIDAAQLREEMDRPLAWLRQQQAPMVPLVAYPYGLASSAVGEAVRAAGYSGGLLVEGGWVEPSAPEWRIPRFNVPAGLSEDGLYLRLSGAVSLT